MRFGIEDITFHVAYVRLNATELTFFFFFVNIFLVP